jgi:hypothetical protein
MNTKQLKFSIITSWLVLSAGVFFILVIPHIVPNDTILDLLPTCEWKAKYNKECALCGMTTAFLRISDGEYKEAYEANKGSIILYGAFLLNQFFALLFLTRFIAPKNRIYNSLNNFHHHNNSLHLHIRGDSQCKR